MYSIEIEQKILKIFVETNSLLNISDIAKKVGTQRITAKKHLERLTKRGLIKEISKPPMRLFFKTELLE